MDMVSDDLILCWDWIWSHDLRHLCVAGQVSLWSWAGYPATGPTLCRGKPSPHTFAVIASGHGEFRREFRRLL